MKNFMCYKDTTFPLNKQGLVLIEGENLDRGGSNRSGKSGLFEGLPWCFFGQTIRGLSSDDIVFNDGKGKNTEVTTWFINGSKRYKVIRYRKHSKHKNALYLKIQLANNKWKDITLKSAADTQAKIQDMIGHNINSFVNSTMFGAGAIKFFTASTDKEKKEILEQILGLDRYSKAHKVAKDKYDEINAKNTELIAKVTNNEQQIEEVEENINSLTESNEGFEEEQSDKLKTLKKELKEHKANKPSTKDVKKFKARIKKYRDEYKEADKSSKHEKQVKKNQSAIHEETVNRDVYVRSKEEKEDEVEDHKGLKGKECPTCKRVLAKSELKAFIKTTDKELRSLDKNIERHNSIIEELEEKNASLVSKVNKHNKKTKADLKEITNKITKLKVKINATENEIETYNDKKEDVQERIVELEGSTNPYEAIIEKDTKKLKTLKKKLSERKFKLERLSLRAQHYGFWVKGFGRQGLPSFILDSIMPTLNDVANKRLNVLTDGQINVDISTQTTLKNGNVKDKFDVSIINNEGSSKYKGNSSGEKRVIDIAIIIAMHHLVRSRNTNPINIAFFDEVFDALDDIWSEQVVKVLESEKYTDSIFVITHKSELAKSFSKRFHVVKENGVSQLKI